MKKAIAILTMVAVMALGMAACGEKKDSSVAEPASTASVASVAEASSVDSLVESTVVSEAASVADSIADVSEGLDSSVAVDSTVSAA